MRPIEASFYDAEYFTGPTKSNYQPYGPGQWAGWLASMVVAGLNPSSLLDVGCAYGLVVERLTRRGVDAHGFDISDFAISQAHRSLRERVWVGSLDEAGSWPDRQFDVVLCTEVLEHLTPDQAEAFFTNAARCASTALVLITTPGHPDAVEGDDSHINIAPAEWWTALAQRCGWRIDNADAFNNDSRAHSMKWAGRFLLLRRSQ